MQLTLLTVPVVCGRMGNPTTSSTLHVDLYNQAPHIVPLVELANTIACTGRLYLY